MLDYMGLDIEAGDIVLYTQAGAGRNLPPLEMGEVVALTKAGVTVKKMDKHFRYHQIDTYVMQGTGRFWTGAGGAQHEYKERVITGKRDADPQNIKYYPNRFYIVRKI